MTDAAVDRTSRDWPFETTPLHPSLGVEIGGITLEEAVGEAMFEKVYEAFLDHQLIYFRDVDLPPATQVAFARRFGEVQVHVMNQYHGYPDHPEIYLLTNLDAEGRREIADTLRGLKRSGKTLLFASHRPDEIIALADRVLVMERGRCARETTPRELWPTQTGVHLMRLHLSMASEEAAARVLRDAGHAVHTNGRGLCVAVPGDRKATPIHALAEAKIEVRDIEILDDLRQEST